MALPKPKQQPEQDLSPENERIKPLIDRVERLDTIFADLLEGAPANPEESGWEELKRALDESRPEGMKLFPKR